MAKKEKKQKEEKKEEGKTTGIMDRITADLQKKFGTSSFITPEDKDEFNKRIIEKNVIKIDSISFNTASGQGGLPKGRIYLIQGGPGIGKTHVALSCFMSASKDDYMLLYCDAEHRLDLGLPKSMGINIHDKNKFVLMLPNSSDEVFEGIDTYLKSGKKLFIVVDSISAIKQKIDSKKANPGWGDGRRPGQDAASLSEFLKVITPLLSKSQSILILLSQYRMKNILSFAYKDATGGFSPEYYATFWLDLKKAKDGEIMVGEQQIGAELILDFKKTSCGLPPTPRRIAIKYGHGFFMEYEMVHIGLQKGIIKNEGSWWIWKDLRIQGKMNFIEKFEQDKALFKELRKEIGE